MKDIIVLYINNQRTIVTATTIACCIVLQDKDMNYTYSYSSNSFYTKFLFSPLQQYNKDNIKYYNVTEEEIFQYNTIFQYDTFQAMVHLYDFIRNGNCNSHEEVMESIIKCINYIHEPFQYSINIL